MLPWGEPAGFGIRFAARLIDGLLLTGLTFVAFGILIGVLFATGGSVTGLIFMVAAWELLPLVAIVVYRLIAEGGPGGQTLGKAWCGIRVVRVDSPGARVGAGKAFGRLGVSALGDLLFGLADLSMLWAPDRRTWGDKASGTAAVLVNDSDTATAGRTLGKTASVVAVIALAGALLALIGSGLFTGGGGTSAADGPTGYTSTKSGTADPSGSGTTASSGTDSSGGGESPGPDAGPVGSLDAQIVGIDVPSTAPDGVDSAGNPTSYGWMNLLDGDPSTAWRMKGDGFGTELHIHFAAPVTITSVGLINGYAKTDPADGTDRYFQERRLTEVSWTVGDGFVVTQSLSPNAETVQSKNLGFGVRSTDVILDIDATTAPGDRQFDYTAISDIDIEGR